MSVRVLFSKKLSENQKEMLLKAGFEPVDLPLIRTEEVPFNRNEVLSFQPDFVVFSSRNGVKHFFSRISIDDFKGAEFIAVGSSTANELTKMGVEPLVPGKFSGEGLIDLLESFNLKGKKFLLVRPKSARNVVPQFLKNKGASIKEVIVYETLPNLSVKEELIRELNRGFEFLVFTSPSTFKSYLKISNKAGKDLLAKARIVPIGDVTKKAIELEGYNVWKVPDRFTLDGIIDIILEWKSE